MSSTNRGERWKWIVISLQITKMKWYWRMCAVCVCSPSHWHNDNSQSNSNINGHSRNEFGHFKYYIESSWFSHCILLLLLLLLYFWYSRSDDIISRLSIAVNLLSMSLWSSWPFILFHEDFILVPVIHARIAATEKRAVIFFVVIYLFLFIWCCASTRDYSIFTNISHHQLTPLSGD